MNNNGIDMQDDEMTCWNCCIILCENGGYF